MMNAWTLQLVNLKKLKIATSLIAIGTVTLLATGCDQGRNSYGLRRNFYNQGQVRDPFAGQRTVQGPARTTPNGLGQQTVSPYQQFGNHPHVSRHPSQTPGARRGPRNDGTIEAKQKSDTWPIVLDSYMRENLEKGLYGDDVDSDCDGMPDKVEEEKGFEPKIHNGAWAAGFYVNYEVPKDDNKGEATESVNDLDIYGLLRLRDHDGAQINAKLSEALGNAIRDKRLVTLNGSNPFNIKKEFKNKIIVQKGGTAEGVNWTKLMSPTVERMALSDKQNYVIVVEWFHKEPQQRNSSSFIFLNPGGEQLKVSDGAVLIRNKQALINSAERSTEDIIPILSQIRDLFGLKGTQLSASRSYNYSEWTHMVAVFYSSGKWGKGGLYINRNDTTDDDLQAAYERRKDADGLGYQQLPQETLHPFMIMDNGQWSTDAGKLNSTGVIMPHLPTILDGGARTPVLPIGKVCGNADEDGDDDDDSDDSEKKGDDDDDKKAEQPAVDPSKVPSAMRFKLVDRNSNEEVYVAVSKDATKLIAIRPNNLRSVRSAAIKSALRTLEQDLLHDAQSDRNVLVSIKGINGMIDIFRHKISDYHRSVRPAEEIARKDGNNTEALASLAETKFHLAINTCREYYEVRSQIAEFLEQLSPGRFMEVGILGAGEAPQARTRVDAQPVIDLPDGGLIDICESDRMKIKLGLMPEPEDKP